MDRKKNRRVGSRQAGARTRSSRGALAGVSGALEAIFWRAVDELEALEARFAVVGGIAIGARIEPRTTKDIDFAIAVEDDAEAEAFVFALRRRGFVVDSLFQRDDGRIGTVRTWHPRAPGILIDFLCATSRIEPEIVAASTPEPIRLDRRAPVATEPHLLAMKIKAGRKKDAADIESLIQRASQASLKRAEHALRLMQSRGADPKRDLVAELRSAVRDVRGRAPDLIPITGRRLKRLKGP
jgi:hypothetical protein